MNPNIPGYFNCHARGLHSVVLSRYADGRPQMRLFYAAPDHDLWMNSAHRITLGLPMSIAIHPHRMDIDLIPIGGPVFQVSASVDPCAPTKVTPWRYTSQLLTGEGGFERAGGRVGVYVESTPLTRTHMKAKDLHTIYVRRDHAAAWIVHEGPIDPGYTSLAYSTSDLSGFSFDGLNRPMTDDQAREIEARAFWLQ